MIDVAAGGRGGRGGSGGKRFFVGKTTGADDDSNGSRRGSQEEEGHEAFFFLGMLVEFPSAFFSDFCNLHCNHRLLTVAQAVDEPMHHDLHVSLLHSCSSSCPSEEFHKQ